MPHKRNTRLYIQSLVLLGGTVFAWSQLIPQFIDFYALYGDPFRFQDCVIPNPLATACLYGSLAFLVAFVWSLRILQHHNETSQRHMRNFLIFCVLFAASVFLFEIVDYYKLIPSGVPSVSCSPGAQPLTTPCFYGMLFFVASLCSSLAALRRA